MPLELPIPVIDLFAGPGGLGEGFCQVGRRKGTPFFKIALSVEKDPVAHKTLRLRSFFRQFPYGQVPDEYYDYLRQGKNPYDLFNLEKFKEQKEAAIDETWQAELGSGEEFDKELDEKIEKKIKGKALWVLIGGPPCQAYSLVGRSRNLGNKDYVAEADPKHTLYKEYLRIIAKHRPSIFVMENVKGLLSSKYNGAYIFNQIEYDLKNPAINSPQFLKNEQVHYKIFSLAKMPENFDELGFPVFEQKDFIIKAENYGIPQARHRVVLLGVREDLCKKILPDTLNEEDGKISTKAVIGHLPRIRSGISRQKSDKHDWKDALEKFPSKDLKNKIIKLAGEEVFQKLEEIISALPLPQKDLGGEYIPHDCQLPEGELGKWYGDPKLEGVLNHSSRTHIVADLHRYLYASCFAKVHRRSPKINEFPDELKPNHKNKDSGNFNDRFRVQIASRPSSTVTCHISKDGHYYIHFDPSQCRSLTVREAARLQTFPDNYFFCGNRTQQYVQVGNAVPPLLAYKIALVIKDFIRKF